MTALRILASTTLAVLALSIAGCTDDSATPQAGPPQPSPSRTVPWVTLAAPPPGTAEVHQCEVFSGESGLTDKQTIVLAMHNNDNKDPQRYFSLVNGWEYPADLAHWTGYQFFGSGDTSVDQHYTVEVLVVGLDVVQRAKKNLGDKPWHAPENPAGSVVAAHLTLKRLAGAGPAECS